MGKIDILFFERPIVDLRKFALKISKVIKKRNKNIKIGAIYKDKKPDETFDDIDLLIHRNEIKNLELFLDEVKPEIIVFTQSRIPDLELMLYAKQRGIKTVMVQEGIMFDGMNINDVNIKNFFSLFKHIGKVIEYFYILKKMCKKDKKSFLKVVFGFLKEKKNVTIFLTKKFSIRLICDYVLTIGDSWSDYYREKYGYTDKNIFVASHLPSILRQLVISSFLSHHS